MPAPNRRAVSADTVVQLGDVGDGAVGTMVVGIRTNGVGTFTLRFHGQLTDDGVEPDASDPVVAYTLASSGALIDGATALASQDTAYIRADGLRLAARVIPAGGAVVTLSWTPMVG